MWLRRAFFQWLFPAALVLPVWLLIGWGVFQAGGWAFLWVLFIAVPSVLVGELVLALLVRARPSVRASRAVSWWDVGGFALWHALTIAVGFFAPGFPWMLTGAVVAFLALFWLTLWQLWNEARGRGRLVTDAGATWVTASGAEDASRGSRPSWQQGEVIVITEAGHSDESRPRR
ncbi:hypothetical protein J2Y69_000574 [Microbacterium resistens]|uniref:MFS transporter permease n=1 Tax=Microbacterium resistens TaxID=156977 RepID=A0ABU1S8S5_9MICO|nr:MFS transporter permease [Microbacterium resistens]MDR6865989.1 hypothetical protein [Microbacterium resistens]